MKQEIRDAYNDLTLAHSKVAAMIDVLGAALSSGEALKNLSSYVDLMADTQARAEGAAAYLLGTMMEVDA